MFSVLLNPALQGHDYWTGKVFRGHWDVGVQEIEMAVHIQLDWLDSDIILKNCWTFSRSMVSGLQSHLLYFFFLLWFSCLLLLPYAYFSPGTLESLGLLAMSAALQHVCERIGASEVKQPWHLVWIRISDKI